MSKRICKGGQDYEDIAHYVMTEFLQHPNAQILIDKGEAMKYMSGMIHLSNYSATSPYYRMYKQSGMVHELYESTESTLQADAEYDSDKDLLTEEILGILTDMESESLELWYIATLFQMWIKEPNYSELARRTKIPRTSISQSVDECREYIRQRLKTRNIDYDY